MKTGDILPEGIAALAPMAGVTDRAFREICISYGCSFVTTEMVSAKGLVMGDRKSPLLMQLTEGEMPAAVQIFGCECDSMAEAAKTAEQTGCFAVDINMGCPAPKVANHGSGSALLRNPELAAEIANACVNAVKIPVTCKIRTGWDSESIIAPELAKMLEQAGVAAITVHGRTRKQMYAPPVDYETIRLVKEAVNIPVIGNGDVCDIATAEKMLKTGCDRLMIGRGAMGAPWIFAMLNEYRRTGTVPAEPTVQEKMAVMINHITRLCEYKGTYTGIREARKHAGWYIKGIRGAASFRREIGTLETLDELKALADKVINSAQQSAEQ